MSFVVPGVRVRIVEREVEIAREDYFSVNYAEDEQGVRYYFSIRNDMITRIVQNVPYKQEIITEEGKRYLLFIDYYNNEVIGRIPIDFLLHQNINEAEKENSSINQQKCKTIELEEIRTEVIEPYTGKEAISNFKVLIDICNCFPDKLIVAASGNTDIDLIALRAQIGELPNNLIIVAEILANGTMIQVRGADIYVNPTDFGIKANGSSTATAIITSIADAISISNPTYGPEEIKRKIKEMLQIRACYYIPQSNTSYCFSDSLPTQEKTEIMNLDKQLVMKIIHNLQSE